LKRRPKPGDSSVAPGRSAPRPKHRTSRHKTRFRALNRRKPTQRRMPPKPKARGCSLARAQVLGVSTFKVDQEGIGLNS